MINFLNWLDGVLWGIPLIVLMLATGIYFTVRSGFFQFTHFGWIMKNTVGQIFHGTADKNESGKGMLHPFETIATAIGGTVGFGNIAGVATAVAAGGPGAVFWMGLMAIVGAASAFIESTLAQIWKVRGKDGEFRGGPAYYIHQALGSRGLGGLFSVLLILCFAFGFNGLQAFNATSALEYYLPGEAMPKAAIASGIVLAVMTAAVIFGGTKRISVITSIVVPIMAIAYIAIALWTTITNITWLPQSSRSSSPRHSTSSRSSAASRDRSSCSASSAACTPTRPAWAPHRTPPPPQACPIR